MKNIILLTTIGAMVTFGAARLSAQSTNDTNVVTLTTNVVQTVNVALNGFEQTGGSNSAAVSTFRITTRDIIRDLGTATGTAFSSRARLTAVTPLGGSTSFVVVDGGTNNTTDVTSIFNGTLAGTPVARARTNPRNGRVTGTQWSIQTFSYGATDTNGTATTGFTFTVQGFTTQQLANGAFNSTVNGLGTRNGDPVVLRGVITGGPGRFQEVSQ
jgi:hypothetical protein